MILGGIPRFDQNLKGDIQILPHTKRGIHFLLKFRENYVFNILINIFFKNTLNICNAYI